MPEFKPYCHKVQYYETDMMGITHHANYIRWMEEARIDFMDQLGFPYSAMESAGLVSPVAKITCEYKNPCTFGDVINISVSVSSFNGILFGLKYTMENEQGKLVCIAGSEHVFINAEKHVVRMKREMPEFCEAIMSVMEGER